jgi:magnesium transporter
MTDDASPETAESCPLPRDLTTRPLAVEALEARVGAPPGELRLPDELVYAGVPRVRITTYAVGAVETREAHTLDEIPLDAPPEGVLWIGVEGLADLGLFKHLMRVYGIHPLAMEDALSRRSQPKLDVHGEVVMLIGVDPLTPASRLGDVELVTLLLGDRWVISIEDAPGPTFDAVRRRIDTPGSRLRRGGADALFQALIDELVDRFFPVLDLIDERLEEIDDAAAGVKLKDVARSGMKLHAIRQSLQKLRRYASPLREAVSSLMRRELPHFDEKLRPYFVDVTDHLSQIVEHVETARELASSIRDLQLTFVNTRMNEIMRGLTVVSTIFLPLTFVAGIYGMNFTYMPELDEPWGYPAALALMLGIAGLTRWVFKRKQWI